MLFSSALWMAATLVGAALADQFDTSNYAPEDVISRDVCIIGGGSTGTYATINLKDRGQTVVVVEKESVLGGHTNTYTDPKTGTKIDYGVRSYSNYSVVRDFFARFDVPLTEYTFDAEHQVFVDFQTGQNFPKFNASFDFLAYIAQLAKYPYLSTSWSLPDPVPEDLLLPFRDFITKYSLQDIAFTIWEYSWGCGDILEQPTVYILKAVDQPFVEGLEQGLLTTARLNNHEIYDKALEELGSDALVSSTVSAAQRTEGEKVKLVVQTPNGKKLVVASKVVVTMPPKIENMQPLGLDSQEESIFQQFDNSAWYVFVVTDTGLPVGYSFQNVRPSSHSTFKIPPLPGMYNLNPTPVDGIFAGWYGGPNAVSQEDAKSDILRSIAHVRKGLNIFTTDKTRFLACDSHTPFQLTVPADAIRNGFYHDLEGLQGHRNTWYTGAAFLSHHAGALWNYTHQLLPSIVGETT
ncbi:hypothetical protein EYZ11_004300 [Aspergillus tanneri]|uniref:Amine oxidase domain-containing protein n=1 Tax=Aspergillus tanneri TaxID=1220188 RepID=A0A4S3JL63_9EURO|nr:uncharacterized protein ATNIH1004_003700 [Aspergillus tanneri]KAA8651009.1 hypothetical protein ATNIH1004_003700 [Aspergillus tanneri]THC96222.1 hypothetical protein EYZ11_004300 [Aspergillus tanneri]